MRVYQRFSSLFIAIVGAIIVFYLLVTKAEMLLVIFLMVAVIGLLARYLTYGWYALVFVSPMINWHIYLSDYPLLVF